MILNMCINFTQIKKSIMVFNNNQYLSNSLEYVYQPEIGQRTKYTANTGVVVMTAANTKLDGGLGTYYTVLQSGSANGTLIKTITVKTRVSVVRSMVRLFVEDKSGNKDLIAEIEIPAVGQGSVQQTFAVSMEVDYMLKYEYYLKATTDVANATVVIAEGLDITFP